jgi:outer membrane protein assembly factor BamA
LAFSFLSAWALVCILTKPITAQDPVPPETERQEPETKKTQNANQSDTSPRKGTEKQKRGSFVVAPLPISSPALGTGIVPVVAYIFSISEKDKISPPSVFAVAGLITDNGSRGFVAGGQIYFKEDTYRITSTFLHGNLNYNVYGLGSGDSQQKLPLNQAGQAFLGEFQRRIGGKFFLGPRFFSGNSLVIQRPSENGTSPLPPDLGLKTTLTALGVRLNRDTRPNRFYPTTGTFFDFTGDFFSQGLGSKYSFQTYKFTFNQYESLSKNQVLAYNLFVCLTGGQPPFYGNCIYGTNNELRGYIAGRYLDRYMATTQLEYRLALPKRFGLVAFGGLGGVVPGGNQQFKESFFLPAGGVGARFTLSSKHHVNLRADIAFGKDGHTWSMGIGEAF